MGSRIQYKYLYETYLPIQIRTILLCVSFAYHRPIGMYNYRRIYSLYSIKIEQQNSPEISIWSSTTAFLEK